MSSNISAAIDEAGKVTKKQKLCAGKVSDALDRLIQLAQQSRQQLEAGSDDAIAQLQSQAEQLGLLKEMNSSTKELHSSINKLSKVRGPAVFVLLQTAHRHALIEGSGHARAALASSQSVVGRGRGVAAGHPSTKAAARIGSRDMRTFMVCGVVVLCCCCCTGPGQGV